MDAVMKRVGRGLVLLSAVILVLKGFGPTERSVAALGQQAGNADDPWNRFEWQGAGRCSSTACHNKGGAPGTKRSEYTTWLTSDKHATAYQTLSTDRSKIIERNLNSPGADWHSVRPETDNLCLKCHAAKTNQALRAKVPLEDGVSCENCHGPAEKWLADHTQPGFHDRAPAAKLELGMVDLTAGNLAGRIRVCVDCHVGNGPHGMEVNHDLIAAGHPRLNFEFSVFMTNYPKHWVEEQDEARAWSLGQLVTAKAALQLVEYRADPRNQRPWPEYAEYDCFACHHDLVEPSWRQQRGYTNRRPGELPWGTWYFAQTEQLAAGLGTHLNALRREMARPAPDRAAVKREAEALATQLQNAAAGAGSAKLAPPALRATLTRIEKDFQARNFPNWDAAAQLYLRFAALNHALNNLEGSEDVQFQSALKAMGEDLAFPKSYDSPRDFQPKPRSK